MCFKIVQKYLVYTEFGPTQYDQHPAWFQGVDGISKENCSIFKLKKQLIFHRNEEIP